MNPGRPLMSRPHLATLVVIATISAVASSITRYLDPPGKGRLEVSLRSKNLHYSEYYEFIRFRKGFLVRYTAISDGCAKSFSEERAISEELVTELMAVNFHQDGSQELEQRATITNDRVALKSYQESNQSWLEGAASENPELLKRIQHISKACFNRDSCLKTIDHNEVSRTAGQKVQSPIIQVPHGDSFDPTVPATQSLAGQQNFGRIAVHGLDPLSSKGDLLQKINLDNCEGETFTFPNSNDEVYLCSVNGALRPNYFVSNFISRSEKKIVFSSDSGLIKAQLGLADDPTPANIPGGAYLFRFVNACVLYNPRDQSHRFYVFGPEWSLVRAPFRANTLQKLGCLLPIELNGFDPLLE